MKSFLISAFSTAALAALAAPAVHAHGGGSEHKSPSAIAGDDSSTAFGRPGDVKAASRTVTIRMSDAMRFTPDRLDVKRGETIRFVIRNDGRLLHELVLGSEKSLEEHAALMRRFPGMEHDEPYMVHVASGKTGELVWTFDESGQIGFACLIPGHFEAGMKGTVIAK